MVVDVSEIETISIMNVPDVIHIGHNLLNYIATDLMSLIKNMSNYVVITDNNLASIYLDSLVSNIQSHLSIEQRVLKCIISPGETSKSRRIKAVIEDFLLDHVCTRDTCLIALGGGVIGDLVGYVASTFMRGIAYVQIPTTLLAMVDSSIGGKTAINTPHGKNLIGTFWQPKRIYIDLAMLKSLPKREFANGMAEIIKTAAISSESEFSKLEIGKEKINSYLTSIKQYQELDNNNVDVDNQKFFASIISACVQFKARVVTEDERENGLRGLLNFGHSIGHAFEAILSPEWLHGECVSVGLLYEAELSCSLGHCSKESIKRLENCLGLYNLPTKFTCIEEKKLSVESIMNTMRVDKKNKGQQKRIVLLKEIGEPLEQQASGVSDDDLIQLLSNHLSNDSLATESTLYVQKLPLPINIHLVACSPNCIQYISNISEAISEKYEIDTITSKENCKKILSINSKIEQSIQIHVTDNPGSNTETNKTSLFYECIILSNQSSQQIIFNALSFIESILQSPSTRHIKPNPEKYSTFITPTVAAYDGVLPNLFHQWVKGTDAVEFRVDLLKTPSNKLEDWIITTGTQLAHLRQLTKLPIIFTVRTIPQAGKFDPNLMDIYYKLIKWAHHWGCEYVDLEIRTLSLDKLEDLMQFNQDYVQTKWILSFHDPVHLLAWSDLAMRQIFGQAHQLLEKYNHDGVIKLVGFAVSFQDNLELEKFRCQVDPHHQKALIMINMGPQGKFSRVANRFLTPATHPDLPSAAAPGQLSIEQLTRIRHDLSL